SRSRSVRCITCHPEPYSAKDLALPSETRSFASTLRMTRYSICRIGLDHRHRLGVLEELAHALGDVVVVDNVVVAGAVDPETVLGLLGAVEQSLAAAEGDDLVVQSMDHHDRSWPEIVNERCRGKIVEIGADLGAGQWKPEA